MRPFFNFSTVININKCSDFDIFLKGPDLSSLWFEMLSLLVTHHDHTSSSHREQTSA